MKFLVLGATGTVGSQVTRELLARGHQIRVLTRNPDKAKSLGAVETVVGDLMDPTSLRAIYAGVDGAFLLTGLSPSESHEGLMAVTAAIPAKLKRIVFLSIHRVDEAPHLPHFGAKVAIEAAVKASGIPFTILRPNNFYQNDHWYRDAILAHGVYPQPIGQVGLSRVDVRDIAEAAAIALTQDGHAGKTWNLVGPRVINGPETAAIWAERVGRPVAYGGDDLEAWEQQALQMFPAWAAYDFKWMYAFFQAKGFKATAEDVAALTKILGHPPRSYEDFVGETAKAWSAEAAGVRA